MDSTQKIRSGKTPSTLAKSTYTTLKPHETDTKTTPETPHSSQVSDVDCMGVDFLREKCERVIWHGKAGKAGRAIQELSLRRVAVWKRLMG